MSPTPDVVIAGGGIAGSALAAVLARGNVQVAVLEHDLEPVDRVRGESMAPWGDLAPGETAPTARGGPERRRC